MLFSQEVAEAKIASAVLGVMDVFVPFEFGNYAAASEREKKRLALDALHSGVIAVGKECGLALELFEQTYRAVLDDDITYISEIRKPHSLNRKLGITAIPKCELKTNCARYYIEFLDRNGIVVLTEELFCTIPMGIFDTKKFLHALKWVGTNEVVVVSVVEKDEMIPNLFSNIVTYSVAESISYDVVTHADGNQSLVVIHVPFS